ncbi:MAG: M20/M25/M40 family metallo-hydrolase [Rikenellaceae bacterium]
MKKIFVSFLVLVSFLQVALAQEEYLRRGVEAMDEREARSQMEFLASDALQGRLTSTVYSRITAQYILAELRELGYEPQIVDFESEVRNRSTGERDLLPMQNILVTIAGEDTSADVIVGAHYDHLGVDESGDVYNGADDNASGVVAVLQIARALKAAGETPKVNIILAFWDGEECGLHGSRNYVSSAEDLGRIKGYLNFDMIGRNTDESRPELVRYIYSSKKPSYRSLLEGAIQDYDLSLEADYRPADDDLGGSDNASFNRQGIPIAWFHTDGHPDYHQVTDTPEKLNWSKLMDIARAAYLISWGMAQE